ncbi:hypothetical protein [Donghicola eburneus]|uniref:Putative membrane protein n=1 Tax=Donghicola eburneus TaxID=393278 RepID=A0A1M4N1L2_9RHOB|nr:hypothetical protein [Donghicola eburneus]SCM68742.1 putative membrane protein [Donghicola eburneus]
MAWHEYSVVGHSRAKIGMFIAFASGALAGFLTLLLGFLITKLVAFNLDVPKVVLWPLTGSAIFGCLFILFDKFLWKSGKLKYLIGVPDISGEWTVVGESYQTSGKKNKIWDAKLIITQSYEKITVHLATGTSSSQSISAAIIDEGGAGVRLIYSYENNPEVGNEELKKHIGYCNILFGKTLQNGKGQYFNGHGRYTHGNITITREANNV